MDVDLKIDSEGMNALVAKAIMDSLTPEKREQLIQAAIAGLLERKRSTRLGASDKSELQEIFEQATYATASQVIREGLEKDAVFREKIDSVFREAVERAFTGDGREKMVEQISRQIVEGLKIDRY